MEWGCVKEKPSKIHRLPFLKVCNLKKILNKIGWVIFFNYKFSKYEKNRLRFKMQRLYQTVVF